MCIVWVQRKSEGTEAGPEWVLECPLVRAPERLLFLPSEASEGGRLGWSREQHECFPEPSLMGSQAPGQPSNWWPNQLHHRPLGCSRAAALMQLCRYKDNGARARRSKGDNQQSVGERRGRKAELGPYAAARHIFAKPKHEWVAWAGSEGVTTCFSHPVPTDLLTIWQPRTQPHEDFSVNETPFYWWVETSNVPVWHVNINLVNLKWPWHELWPRTARKRRL